MEKEHRGRLLKTGGWPWFPFVGFAVGSALLVGLVFGVFAAGAVLLVEGTVDWYLPLLQAHGHAMLVGWGCSMILGVGLHFLPRLRGSKAGLSPLVRWGFWFFALGTLTRVLGQPVAAVTSSSTVGAALFPPVIVLGVAAQAGGILVLIGVLVRTFQSGPPLGTKKGFLQIVPAMATAGTALIMAELLWVLACIEGLVAGSNLHILSLSYNRAATDMLLFGGVMAISLGMSARLFPLTFRTQQSPRLLLWFSSGFLLLGIILTLVQAVGQKVVNVQYVEGLAALAYAIGIFSGTPAVLNWRQRAPKKPGPRTYSIWRDPAAIGVICAYCWAIVAALSLTLFAWVVLVEQGVAHVQLKDVSRHAMGAGFMTLLIVSVGWTMLPGFGGASPCCRGWMWVAIGLINVATLLRVVPSVALLVGPNSVGRLYAHFYSTAGLLAWFGIFTFAAVIVTSWRRAAAKRMQGTQASG